MLTLHGLSRWNSILRVTRVTLGWPGLRANGLALSDHVGAEQVEIGRAHV